MSDATWNIYVDESVGMTPGEFMHTMTIYPNGDLPLADIFTGKIIDGAHYCIACADIDTAERLRSEANAL